MTINRSLSVKLTLVILIVTLTGVLLVAIFARWVTAREFDRFLVEQLRDEYITVVTDHYAQQNSWAGIRQALPASRQLRPPLFARLFGPPPPRDQQPTDQQPTGAIFALLNIRGCVVVPAGPWRLDTCPPPKDLPRRAQDYATVELNGQTIGAVLTVGRAPGLAPPESNYLSRLNLALLWGAFGAALFAVILGLIVAGTLIRPLRSLTKAIRAVAAGELEQKVQVNTQDELGELAHAFNQMSADLAQANQARQQMTADIAHELRNPLMVMTGYIEAIRDGVLAPTPDRLNAMYDEAQHLQRLVADLRTLSLADAGELTLQCEETLPDELLLRVANNYQSQAQEQQVQLEVDVPFALPTVQIDPERIVQVLSNLVSNALRYTPPMGRIVLSGQATDDQVLLAVQDSGAGIAPDAVAHLFDRFYRADPARQTDGSESGLGLAIAKSIVTAHGGTIAVVSAIGVGTTFTVRLPRGS